MPKGNLLDKYSEQDVINANRKEYSNIATRYEDVVFTGDANNRLKTLLTYSVTNLKETKQDIIALDACGGTGQASFLLNHLGCKVHLVDLSSEMIDNANGLIFVRSYLTSLFFLDKAVLENP